MCATIAADAGLDAQTSCPDVQNVWDQAAFQKAQGGNKVGAPHDGARRRSMQD